MLARRGRIGVVQPGSRLEEHAVLAAAAHERRDVLDRRNHSATAAELRDAFDEDDLVLRLGAAVDDRQLAARDGRPRRNDEAA